MVAAACQERAALEGDALGCYSLLALRLDRCYRGCPRKALPKTTLLWLGVPGLKRRHLYDKHMKAVAEGGDDGEPWLAQYRDYDADVRKLWRFR